MSRQAVSKWESGQALPDLDKILALSQLFGVTTDYLLKEAIGDPALPGESSPPVKRVTLAQARAFLQWRKKAALLIGAGTFLCVIGVIPLLLLGAAAELPAHPISENRRSGGGAHRAAGAGCSGGRPVRLLRPEKRALRLSGPGTL